MKEINKIQNLFDKETDENMKQIYKNELDKYYYNINTKEEQDKYINISVINQIKNSDYSFSNSSHTQNILKKYYRIKYFRNFYVVFLVHEILKGNNFE